MILSLPHAATTRYAIVVSIRSTAVTAYHVVSCSPLLADTTVGLGVVGLGVVVGHVPSILHSLIMLSFDDGRCSQKSQPIVLWQSCSLFLQGYKYQVHLLNSSATMWTDLSASN